MKITTHIYAVRKRIKDTDLEKLINILESERGRRNLYRSDEVDNKKDFKKVG